MERIGDMPVPLLFMFRFVRLLLSGHQAVAIENAALLMQIAAFQRKRKRPLLTILDRVFWVTLRSVWSDWRHPSLYVQADTVDFFTVPTITMRVLFVLIILEHDRRKVLHFKVTEHPTGAWTATDRRSIRRPTGWPVSYPRPRQQVQC